MIDCLCYVMFYDLCTSMLILVLVVRAGYTPKPWYVIPNEDHVNTRFFFLYSGLSPGSVAVQAESLRKEIHEITDWGKTTVTKRERKHKATKHRAMEPSEAFN